LHPTNLSHLCDPSPIKNLKKKKKKTKNKKKKNKKPKKKKKKKKPFLSRGTGFLKQ